jgi:hypothetical protein
VETAVDSTAVQAASAEDKPNKTRGGWLRKLDREREKNHGFQRRLDKLTREKYELRGHVQVLQRLCQSLRKGNALRDKIISELREKLQQCQTKHKC